MFSIMFRFKKLVWEVLLLIVLSRISWAEAVYVKYFDKAGKCYTVQKIGYACFPGRKNLTAITLPNSLTRLGGYFLCGCENLEKNRYP